MEEWTGSSTPDPIFDQAEVWIAFMDSDLATAKDRDAFMQRLEASHGHRCAYHELSDVWAKLHLLKDYRTFIDCPKVIEFPAKSAIRPLPNPPHPPPTSPWVFACASGLVIASLFLAFIRDATVDLGPNARLPSNALIAYARTPHIGQSNKNHAIGMPTWTTKIVKLQPSD